MGKDKEYLEEKLIDFCRRAAALKDGENITHYDETFPQFRTPIGASERKGNTIIHYDGIIDNLRKPIGASKVKGDEIMHYDGLTTVFRKPIGTSKIDGNEIMHYDGIFSFARRPAGSSTRDGKEVMHYNGIIQGIREPVSSSKIKEKSGGFGGGGGGMDFSFLDGMFHFFVTLPLSLIVGLGVGFLAIYTPFDIILHGKNSDIGRFIEENRENPYSRKAKEFNPAASERKLTPREMDVYYAKKDIRTNSSQKDGITSIEIKRSPFNGKITKGDYPEFFERIDLNGDGNVSPEEYGEIKPYLDDDLQKHDIYDFRGAGLEKIIENFTVPDQAYPDSREMKYSVELEETHPRVITINQLRPAYRIKKIYTREDYPGFFSGLDLNGDGKTTFGEFRKCLPYIHKFYAENNMTPNDLSKIYEDFTPPKSLYTKKVNP